MQLFTTVVLAANATLVSAWCSPLSTKSSLTLYLQTGLSGEHTKVESGDTCTNINGVWKFSRSNSNWNCKIYDSKGCDGSFKTIDSDGWMNPKFDIKSIECPCV